VVAADVKASAVVTLSKATTVLGKDVSIDVKDGNVVLNGKVKVTVTDIAASNGTIHVIDGVLLPPAM
jgi:transforming growth factor-beta-induced protein